MKANRKRLAVLVVVVGVPLFLMGALASADDGPGKQTLAGVWLGELTILSACGPTGVPVAQFPGLVTYTSDGKVIETPASIPIFPGTVRTSPGLGSWQHDGGQQFSDVFRFFLITVPGGLPAGSATITQAIELSRDSNSYAVTGTADFFDTSGTLIVHDCHTVTATRLE
jgi:hypothetical protein